MSREKAGERCKEIDIKNECATQFESHNPLRSFQNWTTSCTQSPLKRGYVLMRKKFTTPWLVYTVVIPHPSSKRTYSNYLGNNALEKVEHQTLSWSFGHGAELTQMKAPSELAVIVGVFGDQLHCALGPLAGHFLHSYRQLTQRQYNLNTREVNIRAK